MERKTYFVDLANREISTTPHYNASFKITATSDEVALLRDKMNGMAHGDGLSGLRANIPIYPYHHDRPNDIYDENMMEAYRMMYELGDEATKTHIADMGIISDDSYR